METTTEVKAEIGDVKEEMEVEQTTSEEVKEEKKEEPIMLLKGKFNFYYNMNHALKMVIVKPFKDDGIQLPEIAKWCKMAQSFDIEKDSEGNCEAIFYFNTIEKGETCFVDLKKTIETEEMKVFHPGPSKPEHTPNSASISAGQYWEHLKEYSKFAVRPCTLEESKSEQLLNRLIVLENVPETITEEDLLKKFPGASSVIIFPYTASCNGLRMIEYPAENRAVGRIKQGKTDQMHGNEIKLEKYSSRVSKWERERAKNEPFKPCSLENDKRIEMCKELFELEKTKSLILNRDDVFGKDKILQHITMHEKIRNLQDQLKMDTNRRKEEKLSFPEPDEYKNKYTKFAEAPDFDSRKKNKGQKFFNHPDKDGFRKRQGAAFGSNRDQPPNKRPFMNRGGARFGGGGGGGSDVHGLMNMVQGLTHALNNQGGYGGGGGYGGRGGGRGGGYGARGGRY